jgi:PIN domain nuclease of toxin-antitoxin system
MEKTATRKPLRSSVGKPSSTKTTKDKSGPMPEAKKKPTQASWDKWVRECVVSVSPDVWDTHASELSHGSQLLADLKRIPDRVLLDTPAVDYLFRCPAKLSHNALLVLNDENVECLLSHESLLEWAEKMRTGQYMISRENGFFEKILSRFELIHTPSTLDVYQKYLSLKSPSFVDIAWEIAPDQSFGVRLNADQRPTRLIAAHALTLGVPIITPDLRFNAYRKEGLKTIW